MITPRFHLTQTKKTLTITIRAPFCNLEDLDTSCDENIFLFHCTPYYLRLIFPGNLVEDSVSKATFDADTSEFHFVYGKETEGEEFPNLDLITSFLQPKVDVNEGGRKIEILGEECIGKEVSDCFEYGFGLRGGYEFRNLQSEFDIFKINPREVKFEDRRGLRMKSEQNDFNSEHYIADLMDDIEIKEVIKFESPWENLDVNTIKFSDKELDFLKDLPNIQFNLSENQINYSLNSLLEILFAFCYDARTTAFEPTCESHWTITNLSASLCFFDSFPNPKDSIICAFRRSLIYPIYRSFSLSQKVFEDLKNLLKLGEKFIIKTLIKMYDIFLNDDSGGYVLNNLFIKDYIVYVSKWDQEKWKETIENVNRIRITKSDLGLSLIELENSVQDDSLEKSFCKIEIKDDDKDSDDSESDSESSSGNSSSEEDSDEYDCKNTK